MKVCYQVEPSQSERAELLQLMSGGKQAARKLKRAQILLAPDAGVSDEEIAASVGVGGSTVYRTKRRFVEGNLERALSEEPRPGAERKLTGKEEALLVATACSNPPAGRARWTLELLGWIGANSLGRTRGADPDPGYRQTSVGSAHSEHRQPLCQLRLNWVLLTMMVDFLTY